MKRLGVRHRLAGGAFVVLAVVAFGWLPVQEAAARTPSPSPTPTPANAPDRVAITLGSLEPKAVNPHDVIVASGTIVNTSGAQLTNVSVALRTSNQRINTRYDLAAEADPTHILGTTLPNTRQSLGSLAPGESVNWIFSLSVDRLNLPTSPADFGAYPFAVDVRSTESGSVLTTRMPTTLMWMPTGAQFEPTQISWLLPLVDGIHRGNTTTFLDDQLAADLASSGRLGRLLAVASAAPVPLTYVVDPALIDDATVMAGSSTPPAPATESPAASKSAEAKPKPTASLRTSPSPKPVDSDKPTAPPSPIVYQVSARPNTTSAPGATIDGTGSAAATTFLADLKDLLKAPDAALVGMPYGDSDLVALERAGLNKEIAFARSTGQSTLTTDLAAPTLPDVVWPVDGLVDEPTLDDLTSDLVDTVVLSDQALPPADPNAVTGARTDLQTDSGTVRAVLTDTTLSSMLDDPAKTDGGTRATEQRFLAETMLVTEQRPGSGSAVVIAPSRRFDPTDGFAATLLNDSGSVPWLRGANLAEVAADPADGVVRQSLVYPDSARTAETPTTQLAPIAALRNTLASYSAVLGSSTTDPLITNSSVAILRAESSSLRAKPVRAAAIQTAVQSSLATQLAKVYISKPGLITMTSRKQKIPITVINNLPGPVTVSIRLTAVNAARLRVAPQAPVTVPGNQGRHEVLIEVEATTSGRFDVDAQLWTPDANARPFGAPVPFVLNSTAYGAVALVIAGVAAGLVFLLSLIRIARRVIRSRRPAGPGELAADDADDPVPPADSASTTESAATL